MANYSDTADKLLTPVYGGKMSTKIEWESEPTGVRRTAVTLRMPDDLKADIESIAAIEAEVERLDYEAAKAEAEAATKAGQLKALMPDEPKAMTNNRFVLSVCRKFVVGWAEEFKTPRASLPHESEKTAIAEIALRVRAKRAKDKASEERQKQKIAK